MSAVRFSYVNIDLSHQRFCKEAVTWWTLRHPNVLPLLGVTTTENRLVMVSEWMSMGNIVEFTRAGTDVDRLGLVRSFYLRSSFRWSLMISRLL